MEKMEFWFINDIAHPLPNPPPLRASPCRGGGSLEGDRLVFVFFYPVGKAHFILP